MIVILAVLIVILIALVVGLFFMNGNSRTAPQQSQGAQQIQHHDEQEYLHHDEYEQQGIHHNYQQNGQQGSQQNGQQGSQQNSQQDPQQNGNTAVIPQNPASVDAVGREVTLVGKLIRQERTTDQTGMGWASVDYMLVFDSPVTITFESPGGVETYSFTEIQVQSKELAIAVDPNANALLGSTYIGELQPYVGKYVSVTGKIMNTGNAHTCGHARFSQYAIALIES